MRGGSAVAAVALAWVVAGAAQAQETPERVVERYFQSFRDRDFAANAALMDPAALRELHATMASLVAAAGDDPGGELVATFGVASAAELRALPPAVLYERMLRSTLGDREMAGVLTSAELRVLGHVPEGDDVVHVVYRMRMSHAGIELDQVQLAPLRRTADGWRVMLTGSLAGMMQGMGRP
jgi:hypothetical protein